MDVITTKHPLTIIMNYNKLTKTKLIAIAKEREIPGRAKAIKAKGTEDLIKLLEQWDTENSPQPEPTQTEETIEFTSVPTPEDFFNQVEVLDSKLKVNQACNSLLDLLAENHTVATISYKLSAYKKPFYSFQHPNPKLNETVTTKKGTNTQHIAANLLTLSSEQSEQLVKDRQQANASKLGIDEDGDIRDVALPPQNIKSIVQKACSLLSSTKPVDIACGLLPLTGLRRNEQNMPAIEYDCGVIVREWKVIGEFLIAIKGLSKKGGNDGWFARATLAPAQMIVDAQQRFLSNPEIQAIPTNRRDYDNHKFRKAFDRAFKKHWDKELSTIEAYDDNGNKIANNASTHKARAFYTWALVPVLKANGFNQKQAKLYVKNCLGHDDEKDTEKYFNRYDEDQFIEAIDINIPTNFKEVGEMTQATVERLNKAYYQVEETEDTTIEETTETETTETKSSGFDVNKFVDSIPEDLQIKFTGLINDGVDITDALIQTVNTARTTQNQTETKPPVSDKISEILTAVMEYNGEQPEVKNILIPTYAACNRISKTAYGKEIARSTFEDVWSEKGRDIVERLENREIPNISREDAKSKGLVSQEMHNGKYHRKDMDEVISKIVSILEYQE
jgi:phage terminase Nu1 subunit (DNA packaging protein)